jgi:hypothetical protein
MESFSSVKRDAYYGGGNDHYYRNDFREEAWYGREYGPEHPRG